jgi:hypothetical protein
MEISGKKVNPITAVTVWLGVVFFFGIFILSAISKSHGASRDSALAIVLGVLALAVVGAGLYLTGVFAARCKWDNKGIVLWKPLRSIRLEWREICYAKAQYEDDGDLRFTLVDVHNGSLWLRLSKLQIGSPLHKAIEERLGSLLASPDSGIGAITSFSVPIKTLGIPVGKMGFDEITVFVRSYRKSKRVQLCEIRFVFLDKNAIVFSNGRSELLRFGAHDGESLEFLISCLKTKIPSAIWIDATADTAPTDPVAALAFYNYKTKELRANIKQQVIHICYLLAGVYAWRAWHGGSHSTSGHLIQQTPAIALALCISAVGIIRYEKRRRILLNDMKRLGSNLSQAQLL